jgi:C1A family cysteine protease
MQVRVQWVAIAVVALLLGSLGAVGVSLAQSARATPAADAASANASSSLAAELQKTPLSRAFIQHKQSRAAGAVVTQTPDGYGLGYAPPPLALSQSLADPALAQALALPAAYDLRSENKVSPVEAQGPCGSCWTFATFGSLESARLPSSSTILSENHLKNRHDFDPSCCAGGDAMMSAAYLARWDTTAKDSTGSPIFAGPVSQADDPYNVSCNESSRSIPLAAHVQNVYWLPSRQGPMDNGVIKSALMTYGGVFTAFTWAGSSRNSSQYWNNVTAAYYDDNVSGTNHAVTIVGWDDHYARTNFATPPPGDGAWIVKNSWGTSWGRSGYFHVSYYDANFGKDENVAFTAEPATNYRTNYQYDPFGVETSWGRNNSTTGYGANVFSATSDGTLKAVSFWALAPGTQYTAQVYTNPQPNNPTSGALASTISGSTRYAGYYTEPLKAGVPVKTGEKFAVVVKFTRPSYSVPINPTGFNFTGGPIPAQTRLLSVPSLSSEGNSGETYDSKVPATPRGVSFISLDGHSWIDITWIDPYGAVNVHAFAS